jgi:hypothetical protein
MFSGKATIITPLCVRGRSKSLQGVDIQLADLLAAGAARVTGCARVRAFIPVAAVTLAGITMPLHCPCRLILASANIKLMVNSF